MSDLKSLRKKGKVSGLKRVVVEKPVVISQENIGKEYAIGELPKSVVESVSSEVLMELIMLKKKDEELYRRYLAEMDINDTSEIIWKSPLLEKERRKEQQFVDLMTSKIETVEGVYRCGGCGEKKVQLTQKQTRGGDEGMTTIIKCTKCGKRWTES